MADLQITELPVATEANDADLLLLHQGSTDMQITKEILFDNTLQADQNLSDIPNKATARTNLDVPQTGSVLLKANNLSDLANAATARTNLGLAISTDVQAYSAELAALAANNASTGILVQTGTDTVASRTLTAPAAGLGITNPAGIGGNIVFALANDLAALEGLGSTGFAARTGSDAWAQRTLTAPAAGLTISNPAGIAGDPTFALANDLAGLEAVTGTGFGARTASDTWAARTLTAGSSKVSITNPAGVAGDPVLDIVESNLNMNNTGTTLGVPKGGLGLTSCIKGDLLIGSASNTLSKLNAGAGRLTYDPGQATNLIFASEAPFYTENLAGTLPGGCRNIMATFTISTGTRYYIPLILHNSIGSPSELQFYVQTGAALTMALGLYASTLISGSFPSTKPSGSSLASGTVSTSTNGAKGVSISSYGRISPGIYFIAIELSSGSLDISGFKVNGSTISLRNQNANNWGNQCYWQETHSYDGTMGTVGTVTSPNVTYDSSIIPALYLTNSGAL